MNPAALPFPAQSPATPIVLPDSVAAIKADIMRATPPTRMPEYWRAYRRLVSPRLHVMFRDPRVREAVDFFLWRLWTDRAASAALAAPAKEVT